MAWMEPDRHRPCRFRGGAAALAVVATLGSTGMAAAQDRPPPLRLTEDVAITFRHPVDGAELAGAAGIDPNSIVGQALGDLPEARTRVLRQAATGRVRAENSGFVEITDRRMRRSWQFDLSATEPAARVVTLAEGDDEVGMGIEEAGQDPEFLTVADGTTDEVAGIPCTNWRLRLRDEPEEEAIQVCFAADGLALRSTYRRAGMTSFQEAVEIERGEMDPALFTPPDWPVRAEREP